MNIWSLILFWLGITAAPSNYNTSEYYEDCFTRLYKDVWDGTIFAEDVSVKSLSFYRAMTCFYDSGQADIVDRRALLYSYLSGHFDTEKPNSTLNRYKKILPVNSQVVQILGRVCKLYDESPERLFSENEKVQSALQELYESLKFDSFMQNTYQKGKLTGNIAVNPKYINGKLHLTVYTPDMYRVLYEEDGETIKQLFYPDYIIDENNKKAIIIKSWTKEEFKIEQFGSNAINTKTVPTEAEPNNYGEIPFAFLVFGESFYPSSLFELIESQLDINKIEFQARLDVDFNATPVKIAINIPPDKIKLSPDAMINIQEVEKDGISNLAEPQIKNVPAEPQYDVLLEHVQDKSNDMQRKMGIPNSMLEGDTDPPSGISRLLEMSELLEIEKRDIPILTQFENDLLNMIVLVANTDNEEFNINPVEIENFAVYYPPPAIVIEPEQEYEFDKQKVKDYVLDSEIFVKKHGNINSAEKFEDVIAIIEERKEKLKQLNPFKAEKTETLDTPANNEIETQKQDIENTVNNNIGNEEDENEQD